MDALAGFSQLECLKVLSVNDRCQLPFDAFPNLRRLSLGMPCDSDQRAFLQTLAAAPCAGVIEALNMDSQVPHLGCAADYLRCAWCC